MTQVCLNNIIVVHIHKILTNTIDVRLILTEFLWPMKKEEKCLAALNQKTHDSYVHVTVLHCVSIIIQYCFLLSPYPLTVIFVLYSIFDHHDPE